MDNNHTKEEEQQLQHGLFKISILAEHNKDNKENYENDKNTNNSGKTLFITLKNLWHNFLNTSHDDVVAKVGIFSTCNFSASIEYGKTVRY